jgi:TPR repeat protein
VTDDAQSLELARESSGKGSRYGQCVLGRLCHDGAGGVARDNAQALAFYQLAAAQNLDEAQSSLGEMYNEGDGVAQDHVQALRLYQIAASQGHPESMYWVALCYEIGSGVIKNKAEAIRWYERAHAAGHPLATTFLQRLVA